MNTMTQQIGHPASPLVNALAVGVPIRPAPDPAPPADPVAERIVANTAELDWAQRLVDVGPGVTMRDALAATLEAAHDGRLSLDRGVQLIERIQGAGDKLHSVLVQMLERATMTRNVLANVARKRAVPQDAN